MFFEYESQVRLLTTDFLFATISVFMSFPEEIDVLREKSYLFNSFQLFFDVCGRITIRTLLLDNEVSLPISSS